MPVQSSDVIVLVPGLLGFGSFGAKGRPVLSYFQHVQAELERILTEELGLTAAPTFYFHEPPPTGPLAARVASLATALDRILNELPEGARAHIIGHSTGGLDARLLVNLRYRPDEGPSVADKRRLMDRIGGIVALSAPMGGAPFAAHVAPLLPHLVHGPIAGIIAALYLLSILNTAKSRGLIAPHQYAAAAAACLSVSPLAPIAGASLVLRTLAALDPEVVSQVRRFLTHVVDDNRLFDDLGPRKMAELNARIAGGDVFPIRLFATVSPPPPLVSAQPTRQIYALAYRWAMPWLSGRREFPSAEWIGPRKVALETRSANDAVVTTASQLDLATGVAQPPPQIIEADHLDAIGHFDGVGETFFKSDANMTSARFRELWRRIAQALWTARAQATPERSGEREATPALDRSLS